MVLLMVLVIAAIAGMAAVTVMFRLRGATAAAAGTMRGEQAWLAAMSGIRQAVAVVQSAPSDPTLWQDNPALFQNQLVVDDGANKWYFTVYAPDPDSDREQYYGVIDETGKLDLNFTGEAALLALPGMTQPLVDALMDWRDSDNKVQGNGAEQAYYAGLSTPYNIRNGPLTTVEEMLLVRGYTGSIVFGEDANLNGMLDGNEDDGSTLFPPDNSDGQLQYGLERYLTVWSKSPNTDSQGQARLDINGKLSTLANIGLSKQTMTFLRAYRQSGHLILSPSSLLEMAYRPPKDSQGSASHTTTGANGQMVTVSRIDLVDMSSSDYQEQQGDIPTGVDAGELPLVMDRLAVRVGVQMFRVNVNTAPQAVLAAIPVIGTDLAGRIVGARRQLDSDTRETTAWLYTSGLLTAQQYREVTPVLCAKPGEIRIRVVGFGVPCGQFKVLGAVVDLTQTPARIVYLRDLTKLGWPTAVEVTNDFG